MLTWGSKYIYGLSGASFVGAMAYGLVTGGSLVGVISAGYKGGVGDHIGYGILVTIFLATILLGTVLNITRDSDTTLMLDGANLGVLPPVSPPSAPSYWGIVAAFGVVFMVVGVALSKAFFILGLAIIAAAAIEWCVLAWADSATGDPEVNAAMRQRVLGPFELPMLSTLGIAVVVIGVSRVLLAVSQVGSVVVASVLAAIVFGAIVALSRIDVSRRLMGGLAAVLALAILAGGIVGAAVGEREIGHDVSESGEHE